MQNVIGDEMEPEVLVQKSDGVATIAFNRPKESNAMGWGFGRSLLAALDEVEDDQTVSAVVLTGAGRNFCAGAKVGEVVRPEGVDEDQQYYAFRDYARAVSRIRNFELPVVCALNGGAVGGGAAIAIACDLIVAAERAYCLFAFGRMGASAGDLGCAYMLPRMIGTMAARQLLYTGGRLDAERGRALGLFCEVVPDASVVDRSIALAREIGLASPRHALTATKQVLMRGETTEFETCMQYERYVQAYLLNGGEHKRLLREFLETKASPRSN
jgi:enoyl-CoA hydratase/carnithine racemase